MTLRIGSLFSGYAGLDLGVGEVLDAETVWFPEFDEAPSKILAHHWPDIPNYGDITKVDWLTVPPVDILTGGFPCQDLSLAGRRSGMRDGTRSGLWADYLKAIDVLRPQLVIIENVRGLLSGCAESNADSSLGSCPRCADPDSRAKHSPNVRALGRVLIDLAGLGYDAEWGGVEAAETGAPHHRFRVFVVAYPRGEAFELGAGLREGEPSRFGRRRSDYNSIQDATPDTDSRESSGRGRLGTVGVGTSGASGEGIQRQRSGNSASNSGADDRTTPDTDNPGRSKHGGGITVRQEQPPVEHPRNDTAWGVYEPAIRRWEQVLGRPAPSPTNPDGKNGAHRLAAEFVEWLMGLDAGHVTDPAIGLTRNQQLKALGNGVVPAQAAMAVRYLLSARS